MEGKIEEIGGKVEKLETAEKSKELEGRIKGLKEEMRKREGKQKREEKVKRLEWKIEKWKIEKWKREERKRNIIIKGMEVEKEKEDAVKKLLEEKIGIEKIMEMKKAHEKRKRR